MLKNLAATDLVAARSPTSRRLLCNLAGTDRGTLLRPLRLVEIVSRGEVAKRLQCMSDRGFMETQNLHVLNRQSNLRAHYFRLTDHQLRNNLIQIQN